MRFYPKIEESHPRGTVKIERWFAVLPVTINDETRVLEQVTVEYEWFEGYGCFADPGWFPKRFL
jgi:hypothetical protein